MPEKINLADFVSSHRKKHNLTQHKLAKMAGVPQSTIGRIETGKTEPSINMLEKIASATNCVLKVSFEEK